LVGLTAGCLSAKKVIVTLNRRLCGSATQTSFGYSRGFGGKRFAIT